MFKTDTRETRRDERTMPTQQVLHGMPYVPSWAHQWRTTWTDRLGGHHGLVGQLDAIRKGGAK